MKTIKSIDKLQKEIRTARSQNKRIGLVPTMGALHAGHLSLVESAAKENELIIVTIFVNPTQFNNPDDLDRYPRNLNADLEKLNELPVDLVFAPDVKEMYPEADTRTFNLEPLDQVMEGKYRPGHFNGVAQIVSKLFTICTPDRAYFGQKDFQQLVIIQKLTALLGLDIEIVACPIIREDDGLAMSSRNILLSETQRSAAPLIAKTLEEAKQGSHTHSPAELIDFVKEKINSNPHMRLEYFEIVDDQSLIPIESWSEPANKIACIAVHLGEIRLIDNIYFD